MSSTAALQHNLPRHHTDTILRRDKRQLTSSKSYDNLSDTLSVTSEESDNFKPRIIRPRR